MGERDDLLRKAKEARRSASPAPRMVGSGGVSTAHDIARLTAFAEEMEAKAADLEADALAAELSLPPVSPVVPQPQQQAQQQQQSNDATPPEGPAGRAPPRPGDITPAPGAPQAAGSARCAPVADC
jgi:hypothetical protein